MWLRKTKKNGMLQAFPQHPSHLSCFRYNTEGNWAGRMEQHPWLRTFHGFGRSNSLFWLVITLFICILIPTQSGTTWAVIDPGFSSSVLSKLLTLLRPWKAERFQSRTHETTGKERLCLLLQDSLRKGSSKTCLWNLPVSRLQHLPSWLTREVPPRPAFEIHCPWYSHWWPTPLWLMFQRKALSRHPECLPRA